MSQARQRGGPKQVVQYNSFNDPSGLHRLPRTRGFWRYVAYLGFLVMTAGLGVFGFMLLSTFGAMSGGGGGVPRMPPGLPIGFGIALVGGLAYQVGLVLGAPQDDDPGPATFNDYSQYDGGYNTYVDNSIDTGGGSLTMRDYAPSVQVRINRELANVDQLADAVARLRMTEDDRAIAESRIKALRHAVATNADESEVDRRLRRVADVLVGVGALTGGATAVFGSLLRLAGVLGSAGKAVYDWLDQQRR